MAKQKTPVHKLSVVYATYNEEKNIARSLASIEDIADEIIVVDGSSPDSTREIAKEHGARVIKTTNKPIFHINKQMAMDEAKYPWVLQMDADEVVDDTMKRHIREILATEDLSKSAAGYWLQRKNWFLNRFLTKGGQYPDPVIRFYQRGKARLPMKTVHEQMEVDGAVETLRGHLLHYNSPTFSDYLRKSNTYTSLTAQELAEQGVEPSFGNAVLYMIWKPLWTFVQLYFRHKGILDGFAGFIFALFSGVHFLLAYIKLWEMKQQGQK
ncbi:glycosyltransferase family 2 protein [Candidatus Woesebacteria bacterium]|nr:glycosyltransferase family 2 protein [Candidatus Woesebacteria bacterium]MCD8506897.1 glycosyltransferase family 2 protein [Candidatus Woesebacteria bacterium]MCD8527484.1 glycosyltransferase family 2 protein [Candidatus Woesebacteria bacterium]MCD8546225.1 glycosyltransferase family 2 protein [Candidatus Woesebacteria bacterium]